MPCDSARIDYLPDPQGNYTIFTQDGVFERGYLLDAPGATSEKGYMPHWRTCPHVSEMSRVNYRYKALDAYKTAQKPVPKQAPVPETEQSGAQVAEPALPPWRVPPGSIDIDVGEQLTLFPPPRVRLKELWM